MHLQGGSRDRVSPALIQLGLCRAPASSSSFPLPALGNLSREKEPSWRRDLHCSASPGLPTAPLVRSLSPLAVLEPPALRRDRSGALQHHLVPLWGHLEPLQKLCVINLCSCIDAFHVWRRMGFSQMSKHLLGFHSCGAVSFIVFWVITQAASVP